MADKEKEIREGQNAKALLEDPLLIKSYEVIQNDIFQKCGRAKGSGRAYPKCVPASKAARMTKAQITSAVSRKRAKAQGVGGKPTNVST